jgi:hypothetical protein
LSLKNQTGPYRKRPTRPIQLVMDENSLISPEWRSELQFQLSLLRLMYPKTSLAEGASAQMAEWEQLQQPAPGSSIAAI